MDQSAPALVCCNQSNPLCAAKRREHLGAPASFARSCLSAANSVTFRPMPRFKTTIFNCLAAISLLFTVLPPVMAAAASDKVIDVTKAGVVGDGTTLNTASIQKAIDDCAAAGGATVAFPAGRYLTGTIQIKS